MLVLLLVTIVLRSWTIHRWTWEVDDWTIMWRASTRGVSSYLLDVYNVHLLPGALLLTWLMTRIAPLDFTLVVVLTTTLCGATLLVWARAFAEIWGEQRRLLLPLALMTLTPLAVRPTMWWSAAMLIVPVLLSMGICVLFAARYARRPATLPLVGVLASFVLGLLFFEKAILIVAPVFATLLYCSGLSPLATVRRYWPVLAGLASVVVGYVTLYVVLVAAAPEGQSVSSADLPGPVSALRFYADVLTRTLAPAVFGGPWGTTPTAEDERAAAGPVTLVLATLAATALVVAAIRWRHRAWVPLALLGSYAVVSYTLVILSRASAYGLPGIRQERYSLDVLAVVALAVAMLICRDPHAPAPVPRRAAPGWVHSPRLLPAVGVLLAASLLVGNVLVVARVGIHPGRAWVDNLTAEISRRAPVDLFDTDGPIELTGPRAVDGRLSRMLSPLGSEVSFDGPAERLYVPDAAGHLRKAKIADALTARPGTSKGCGYAITSTAPQRIPLNGTLFRYRWGMDLTAFAGKPSVLRVEVDDVSFQLPIPQGFAGHQIGFAGAVTSLRIALQPGSAPVCVTEVIIGQVTPSRSR